MHKEWRRAALEGDLAVIDGLLHEGIDIDSKDRHGQTALMLAARHGHEQVVQLLLGKEAALDVTAKYRLSALMLAVINRQAGIAKMLVAAGADTTLRGSGAPGFSGKTAADLAEDAGLKGLASYLASYDRPE
ncbi:MAG: ankyrin repeat domain-containing protein [Chromatiaceae bacterium]|jgi:ankyrin repeat protein